ncbi:integrase arm-type DNA-binding domain-containing protein [Microvirga sp. RSM25]|uniref:integrase arm-type DNA-binding domain-containing protein n=1 Tax=Microvirga sp. RSM25 TaxID=3273802 RepID=UPI00384F5843
MAPVVNKLSARAIATLKVPGRHSGEGGFYLSISPDGSRRRWVFLFRWKAPGGKSAGKLREMGLESANTISLAQARDRAARA